MKREPIPGEWYGRDYYEDGTKSAYKPYGPGGWAKDLAWMVQMYLRPESVLDVGCAFGFVVKELETLGIKAQGFDISLYAIEQRVTESIWVGSADDENAYVNVDLILASELPEHLTEEQAPIFLRLARQFGQRALLLICVNIDETATEAAHDSGDQSHINVRPMIWWEDLAAEAGWTIDDASKFNEDQRSIDMHWAGRFLLLG